MKKNALMIMTIATSALLLGACETTGMGDVETAPPYSEGRTAGKDATVYKSAPKKADKMFKKAMSK